MDKEEFFSKFNIKDYNNELEKILEKKSFSAGTKNILLNILYKIEASYEDYSKVKATTRLKKEILEEVIDTIEKNCNEIELIKPKLDEKTKLANKSFIVEKHNKKIISYPNEKTIFYGICHLAKNKFIINKKYDILKEPMENLLNIGYIMEQEEIVRDFDGWSWNISSEEIENYIYNIVYQNIRILIGENYLLQYINNFSIMDFINQFEIKIRNICNEEIANQIIMDIYKIAILENIKNNKLKQEELINKEKELQKDLNKMENKKTYLQELASKKKIIGKDIKRIDEIINDSKILRENFIKENSNLKEEEKIFSLSEYCEILQAKRKNLLQNLKNYSSLMKPMNYVKTKSELKKKVDLLAEIDFNINLQKQAEKTLIDLQTNFLKVVNEKIKNVESKKNILNYIYLFRYYKLLKINRDNQIKDVDCLKEQLTNTEKHLITRGCNLKAINIIYNNIEKNYDIISKILNSNIIDLEEMHIELKKQEDKILINIYDDNIINNSIEYEDKEKLNIKLNKKIKLFN
ncbi:MAG: hypothetical protein Q4G09_07445 [Clostridia bacterium]|nr:hypothetical protein [Clostridia bacterium]